MGFKRSKLWLFPIRLVWRSLMPFPSGLVGLSGLLACLCMAASHAAFAHGATGLINPPPGRLAHRAPALPPPATPRLAPPPGMLTPPPPLLQAPSPFVTPLPYPPGYPAWHAPHQPPPFTHGDPSLRDRRLFEEELRLRQWHEHALRRHDGAGEHGRQHDHHRHR